MKIYVVIHRASGDALNAYEGMNQDEITQMVTDLYPEATCTFISLDEWLAACQAAAQIKGIAQ